MNCVLKKLGMWLLIISAAISNSLAEGTSSLIYEPDGDAIVITNGTRWNNRPLYCFERFAFAWSGEMPSLNGQMGVLYAGIDRGGNRIFLQDFAHRIMRYRPGRMEWELTDPRLPGLTAKLLGTTLADATGFTARLAVEGAQVGDAALWCFFPPNLDQGGKFRVQVSENGYQFDREPASRLAQIQGKISAPVVKWEQLNYSHRENVSRTQPLASQILSVAGLVATVPLAAGQAQSVAVACDENDPKGYATLVRREQPLDPGAIADPAKAFDLGYARVKELGERVVVATPDPYLNAGVGVAVAASMGIFVNPCFVHGGSQWRQQQPGWRTMGGAIYYGWPDQVRRAVEFWGKLQVKTDPNKLKPEFSRNGCQQAGNSRFLGAGFIDYKQPPHYEFQTQFFDEAIRAWRATADPELEKVLLPMLELHLQRCRECFDPDGDGLYESYNNTWPSDSIWFNGGGTPEQSAYVYYGQRAAADLRRRLGDAAGAAKHDAEADKIRAAVNRVLWLADKGHFASFVEAGGHHRVHDDAWIYAQHVPIEAGLTTPEQAWSAMYYTEWAMERIKLPYGEMRQSSNFVPGQWSIRELFHGDNFAMALGYFLSGQGDDGWQILRGTMIESMYGDGVRRSGYSNEQGGYGSVNKISPGGLSHPNCAIDFTDISSMFARAVVEGLFGYRPDYPNGVVRCEPALPSNWEQASIHTPDFALQFKTNLYSLHLTKPATVKFALPVRSASVKSVKLNGQSAKFTIEPWTGFGMLHLATPVGTNFVVELELEGANRVLPSLAEEKSECVPGYHLSLAKMDGDVPRYQVTKVHVLEKPNPKILREAPANATWRPVDLSAQFNGDIRAIFQQDYRSPRPDSCSMCLGYDGWSAWTFIHWGIKVPEIKLAGLGQPVFTPQRVAFAKLGAEKNIAFTSLWDNWPRATTVPVNAAGDAVWLLVCGSSNPMQGKIANAMLRFHYADGVEETLGLVPPENFWSLCRFGRMDYDYRRDGFSLPNTPPPLVQLGENCRAMVYGWKLRPGVALRDVTLETLSQEVVIGLMGVSVMNPKE